MRGGNSFRLYISKRRWNIGNFVKRVALARTIFYGAPSKFVALALNFTHTLVLYIHW